MTSRGDKAKSNIFDNRLLRFLLFAVTFVLATLPIFGSDSLSVYPFILIFPAGLIAVIAQNYTDTSVWFSIFGWLIYLGILLVAMLTKDRPIFVIIYVGFLILLAMNITGCNEIIQNSSFGF